ncbi:unnamed protein product, partial [Laminaria digitata]
DRGACRGLRHDVGGFTVGIPHLTPATYRAISGCCKQYRRFKRDGHHPPTRRCFGFIQNKQKAATTIFPATFDPRHIMNGRSDKRRSCMDGRDGVGQGGAESKTTFDE